MAEIDRFSSRRQRLDDAFGNSAPACWQEKTWSRNSRKLGSCPHPRARSTAVDGVRGLLEWRVLLLDYDNEGYYGAYECHNCRIKVETILQIIDGNGWGMIDLLSS
jgi:hypothetical protein